MKEHTSQSWLGADNIGIKRGRSHWWSCSNTSNRNLSYTWSENLPSEVIQHRYVVFKCVALYISHRLQYSWGHCLAPKPDAVTLPSFSRQMTSGICSFSAFFHEDVISLSKGMHWSKIFSPDTNYKPLLKVGYSNTEDWSDVSVSFFHRFKDPYTSTCLKLPGILHLA